MTGRRARRALDRILAANSLDEVLACPPDARSDVYEALLALETRSAWWWRVAASVARRRAVTPAYVVDRAMAWLATLAELRRHDLYAFFGVEPRATADEIRTRWRELARRYHPDHGGTDPVLFRRFQEAYTILSDPVQRMRYEDGWRRRNGPAVALIAQAARPAPSRREGTARRRATRELRRVRAWVGRMRPAAGPAFRTIGVAAAIVLVARFGRLPEWPAPPAAAPAVAAKTPAPVAPRSLPPARPVPPPPLAAPAPIVTLAPTPPAVVSRPPATFGETVALVIGESLAEPELPAESAPEVVGGTTPLPAGEAGRVAQVASVARGPRTTTPASVCTAASSVSTSRSTPPAAAPDTATPAGRRRVVVTAEVVPATPPPPVMHLAAAVTAPPVANVTAGDRRPWTPATTPPPVVAHAPAAPPPAKALPAKSLKVADKRPTPARADKTTKVAAAKRPAPRVVAKAATPARRVAVASAAPAGMMMALTSPEPVDLRSAQLFVREFARRYSAHEAAGLLELFAPGGTADGRHGTAIADGFGATFRRLGDVRLEPAHVELQPMAGGAVVRADYTLFVPGRDPVRGRAQWVLVREGGAVRASQMLSATVSK